MNTLGVVWDWVFGHGYLLAFIGVVLAGLGALATHLHESRQRDQHQDELRQRDRELQAKTDEISGLNRQIAELTQRNLDTITGGNSFCYLRIVPSTKDPEATMFVHLQGEFPLRDVFAQLTTLERFNVEAGRPATAQELAYARETFNIRVLSKTNSGKILWPIPNLAGDTRRFNVEFTALINAWVQVVILRRVNDKWLVATKVVRRLEATGEKPLDEHVDDGFPGKADGKIVW